MNKTTLAGGAAIGLIAALGLAATVSAQTVAAETGLSEAEAIEIALMEVPGEVQEVELEREDGMQVYEVEILTAEGVEMEVEINADTGDILEVEADGKDCDKERDA